jgi:hypothetical protein
MYERECADCMQGLATMSGGFGKHLPVVITAADAANVLLLLPSIDFRCAAWRSWMSWREGHAAFTQG